MSQLLTLYITPVYYVYIENSRLWLARRKTPSEGSHVRGLHGAMPLPTIGGTGGSA